MSSRWMLAGLLLISVSSLSTGCRTDAGDVPSVARLRDRIGKMTFDDAVRQMGPPATRIELRDRSVVAATERSSRRSTGSAASASR